MKLPAPELVIAGKYHLEGQLAEGGMGSVWVARHLNLDVPVAIKFMGPECASSEEGRTRFEREAKAAAYLQSANVVNVQDYGVDDGLAYIVMELLTGEDLEDRLYKRKRLSLEEMLDILTQTSKALRRAQDLGIVHRDLKPQNLFLAGGDDGEEIVKVLDFGIAKETGPVLLAKGSNTGQIIGSPHYMSPEAVRGVRDIDFRSDLWSMGVITFQSITGRLPFPSENVGDVMGMILADPLPKATEVAPDLPPEIDSFFEKALCRDRTKRFQSAREMADAFADIVKPLSSGQPRGPMSSRPTPGPSSVRSARDDAPMSQEAGSLTPSSLSAVETGTDARTATPPPSSVKSRQALSTQGPTSEKGGAPVIAVAAPGARDKTTTAKLRRARGGAIVATAAFVTVLIVLFFSLKGPSSSTPPATNAGADLATATAATATAATVTQPLPEAPATAAPTATDAPAAAPSGTATSGKTVSSTSGKGGKTAPPKPSASAKVKHPWGF